MGIVETLSEAWRDSGKVTVKIPLTTENPVDFSPLLNLIDLGEIAVDTGVREALVRCQSDGWKIASSDLQTLACFVLKLNDDTNIFCLGADLEEFEGISIFETPR